MVWRDTWDDTPNLVIIAEEDAQEGVIRDSLLFLGLEPPAADLIVSDRQGHRYRLTLPEDLEDPVATIVRGIDLTVEPLK